MDSMENWTEILVGLPAGLAMTIQKISINYCSYHSFGGTFMWSVVLAMLLGWRLKTKGKQGWQFCSGRLPVDNKRGKECQL